jgi:hypothetical protein
MKHLKASGLIVSDARFRSEPGRARLGKTLGRSRLAILVAVLLMAAAACPGSPPSPGPAPSLVRLSVDTASQYTFHGWGTSLAWWANIIGDPTNMPGAGVYSTSASRTAASPAVTKPWPAAVRSQVLQDLFADPSQPSGQLPDGQLVYPLGLNVLRYNIGASPVHLAYGSPPLPSDCQNFGYGKAVPSPQQASNGPVDINSDAPQLSVLQQAMSLIQQQASTQRAGTGPVLEAFANSPPWWLQGDKCPAGQKNQNAQVDPNAYANYLVQVLQAFHSQAGIDFSTVEPFNEPWSGGALKEPWSGGGWWTSSCDTANLDTATGGCQEGANFDPIAQRQVTAALCDALAHSTAPRVGSTVAVDDGNSPDDTNSQVDGLLGEPCVSQINTHSYNGNGTAPYGKGTEPYGKATDDPHKGKGRPSLAQHETGPGGKTVWMSEFGSGSGTDVATQVADDLQELHPSAWVYWQAVDNAWGLVGGGCGASGGTIGGAVGCAVRAAAVGAPGGFPNVPSTPAQIQPSAAYWALGQYSRYIRPGSTIYPLAMSHRPDDNATRAVVAKDPSGQVIVVASNPSPNPQPLDLDLSALGSSFEVTAHELALSGNSPSTTTLSPGQVPGGSFTYSLPGDTVTTYVLSQAPPPATTTTTTTVPEPTATTTTSTTTTATTTTATTTTATTTTPSAPPTGCPGVTYFDAQPGDQCTNIGGTLNQSNQGGWTITVGALTPSLDDTGRPQLCSQITAIKRGSEEGFMPGIFWSIETDPPDIGRTTAPTIGGTMQQAGYIQPGGTAQGTECFADVGHPGQVLVVFSAPGGDRSLWITNR